MNPFAEQHQDEVIVRTFVRVVPVSDRGRAGRHLSRPQAPCQRRTEKGVTI
jgi:hypothetical protein